MTAERDVSQYSLNVSTNTSIALGVSSYKDVLICLEQDFGLSRYVRGVDTVTLGIELTDSLGIPVDADSTVSIEILDIYSNIVQAGTDTKTGSGTYSYAYTPPASSTLGIYKATHSFTVGGSSAAIEEWFRVVSTTPGSYFGTVIRGEATWTGDSTITDARGILNDPDDNEVLYTVRSPRGVVLIDNATATRIDTGEYRATYAPSYNDPTGTFSVTFTYTLNSVAGSEELYFKVSERKEELWVDAEEFRSSPYGKSVSSTIASWTNEEIEEVLSDSQSELEDDIGYKLTKNMVTGEKLRGIINQKNELFMDLLNKPVYKLIRVLLRYHPSVEALELPVSAWEIYHDLGQAKYLLQAGIPRATSVDNLLAETAWTGKVDLIVDYESGYDEAPRAAKKAVKLVAVDTIEGINRTSDVSQVKSGNHSVKYFDPLRLSGKSSGSSGMSAKKQEAIRLLKKLSLEKAKIV